MFKNEVEDIVKNKRFFGTLAWLGAGWVAGVLPALLARSLAKAGVLPALLARSLALTSIDSIAGLEAAGCR